RSAIRAAPSRAGAAAGSRRLELPSLARLQVVPFAAKVLQQARLLDLPLEGLERPVEPIIVVQCHFNHGHTTVARERTRPVRPLSDRPSWASCRLDGLRVDLLRLDRREGSYIAEAVAARWA